MQILKIKLSQLQFKCNHDWASDRLCNHGKGRSWGTLMQTFCHFLVVKHLLRVLGSGFSKH